MTFLEPPPVSKKELVRQLSEASRLLELVGAEGFRANAYAAAARQLDAFEGDFTVLFAERRLAELRGIGKGLAAEMYALRSRERLEVLDDLYAQVPDGVRGLLRVSGLGPKKARLLWLSGIENLAELVAAAQDGRVAALKGFGAKSAQTLGAAAAFALSATARLRLDEAEVYAAAFTSVLAQLLPDARLHWVGELRRSLETVGTLQAVVTGASAEVLERALVPFGPEVAPSGPVLPLTFEGRRLELYLSEASTLGAALTVQTGEEAFVAALQGRAAVKGLRLTGTGLFNGKERLETRTEGEVFAALGVDYVPPERRDRPLESQAEHLVPVNLVTVQDMRGLVHNHSSWSDGAAPLREMVAAARALGYGYLALADHSKTSYYANGLSIARVAAQAEEIAEIRRELLEEGSEFRVLHGLEVDIMPDGSLDYPDEVLATLDYAVVSVHQHFTLSRAKQTERIVRAVQNPYADILAHPTGRLLLRRPGYEVDVRAVLGACAETGTVVEINANPHRLDLDWREVVRARALGCRFAVNPDAHHPDGYADVRYGILMARKAGVKAAEVVNTAPTAEAFLARLKPKP
jgi:DNA polymerase (family 10)